MGQRAADQSLIDIDWLSCLHLPVCVNVTAAVYVTPSQWPHRTLQISQYWKPRHLQRTNPRSLRDSVMRFVSTVQVQQRSATKSPRRFGSSQTATVTSVHRFRESVWSA